MARKILRYIAVAVLFTIVCLSAEANSNRRRVSLPSDEPMAFCVESDPFDLHMAIEANSNCVAAPLVARVSGSVVRTVANRTQTTFDSLSGEFRQSVNRSTLHLKAVNEARLLRLSPLRIRTRYIYSLRRLVI